MKKKNLTIKANKIFLLHNCKIKNKMKLEMDKAQNTILVVEEKD